MRPVLFVHRIPSTLSYSSIFPKQSTPPLWYCQFFLFISMPMDHSCQHINMLQNFPSQTKNSFGHISTSSYLTISFLLFIARFFRVVIYSALSISSISFSPQLTQTGFCLYAMTALLSRFPLTFILPNPKANYSSSYYTSQQHLIQLISQLFFFNNLGFGDHSLLFYTPMSQLHFLSPPLLVFPQLPNL